MTAKHTPGRLGRNIPPVSKYPILFAGRNTHVAQVVTRGLSPEEAEANADYLCLAWNEFPAMLEALGFAAEALESDAVDAKRDARVVSLIRAILARIDGGV